jgi:hypothetical protein
VIGKKGISKNASFTKMKSIKEGQDGIIRDSGEETFHVEPGFKGFSLGQNPFTSWPPGLKMCVEVPTKDDWA